MRSIVVVASVFLSFFINSSHAYEEANHVVLSLTCYSVNDGLSGRYLALEEDVEFFNNNGNDNIVIIGSKIRRLIYKFKGIAAKDQDCPNNPRPILDFLDNMDFSAVSRSRRICQQWPNPRTEMVSKVNDYLDEISRNVKARTSKIVCSDGIVKKLGVYSSLESYIKNLGYGDLLQ